MLLYCLIHFRFLKGYHTLTYIDSYCRKYLMYLVLLYINKMMVCLLNFCMCLFVSKESTSLTMLLYCLIPFRFLKGMLWLRTLALLIVASYHLIRKEHSSKVEHPKRACCRSSRKLLGRARRTVTLLWDGSRKENSTCKLWDVLSMVRRRVECKKWETSISRRCTQGGGAKWRGRTRGGWGWRTIWDGRSLDVQWICGGVERSSR